ncbi:hypothetical protein MIND_00364600 [Mycena indigotica]|uniref:Afadin and alpha-actinin-binding-domain-containing protein n=1 Tax=Mycena indigotica TaxID=2126181 RepID=A0A8H6T2S7_9AGAR|nr:uncharacterized protein MIND_00364600 [Mycena indigotica]KAF7309923.1 hypothetical protein MIND_00364600 [Mycena indigotica]
MANKAVHWGTEGSVSDISSDILATSSLDYINSQLIAHGFVPTPGLSLDGIAPADLDRVVKCLLGMLSQRVEDMGRTEDLTTKLRTLSYDHERLTTMYRAAADTAASAEREVNLYKSRLTATTRLLQSSESSHKQTTLELQRARSALQSVRATHHAELKKKEREMERMAERWTKLADIQTKVGGAASGLKCSNLKAVERAGIEVLTGPPLHDNALQQSEEARRRLAEDNRQLRGLLLSAVNETQAMLHQARPAEREKEEEPLPLTSQTLFPMASADAANEKLSSLLSAVREAVNKPSTPVPAQSSITPSPSSSDGEIERLKRTISRLNHDVERYQKELLTQATETQEILEQFANDPRVDGDVGENSVELMIGPERDAERERLERIKSQLDVERNKFTEATLRLGHERASVEADRIRLQDEKRTWEVERLLAELPPTPNPGTDAGATAEPVRNSPRKSPGKVFTVGASRKTGRIPKRSLAPPPRAKIEPAFETEVIPGPSSLLPTSFVLPPPSPYSAFPPPTPLLLSSAPIPSLLDTLAASSPSSSEALSVPPVATPANPFPIAKPFIPRMIHAYSPAKPSPLSRILLMSQRSPASPEEAAGLGFGLSTFGLGLGATTNTPLLQLESLPEEGFSALTEDELFPAVAVVPPPPTEPKRQLSLAEELGVSESPPESPAAVAGPSRVVTSSRGLSRVPPTERYSTTEKGKEKEKENGLKGRTGSSIRRRVVASVAPSKATSSTLPKIASTGGKLKAGGPGSVSRARVMAKLPVSTASVTKKAAISSAGAPRRVLLESAEAAHVVRTRSS